MALLILLINTLCLMITLVWVSLVVVEASPVYGKTFEGENFRGYKKNLSLEKFCGLAVSAIISSE